MATTAKTKAKRAAERKSAGTKKTTQRAAAHDDAPSAIELLKQDHREVEGFFEEYQELTDSRAKAQLAAKICLALTVHAQVEEELFYPAARKATKDDDLLDEATVEHASAKHLIAQIESMKVGDDLYDAKVKVLGELVEHHVKEEEDELFPEAKAAKMDLAALGTAMAERKSQLMAKPRGEAAEPKMRKAS